MKRLALLLSLFLAAPVYAQQLNPGGGIIISGGPINAVFPPGPVSITGDSANGNDQVNNVSINGVINVKAFGALGNGSKDDTAAIQLAINAAGSNACVYFPAGNYLVTQDLNFTSSSQVKCVEGDDPNNTKILCEDPPVGGVGGNCADFSGSDGYSIRSIQFSGGTSTANAPKTLLLLGRTSMSQGFGHTLTNVWMTSYGPYTIYDYGHEVAHWYDVRSNTQSTVISACNSAGITSKFQTLIARPTSMSVVNIYGGNFNASGGTSNCAIIFDNACTNGIIYAINLWGPFLGEMGGGGTGLCDAGTGTSFPGQTLQDIGVFGVRFEASDLGTNYKFLDFTKGPSYVYGLNMVSDMMGVQSPQAVPALNFGTVNGSRIALDAAPEAASVLTLSATAGNADDIRGIPTGQMSANLVWGPTVGGNAQGTSGNFISWFDGTYGHVDAGGAAANVPMTTLGGTTAGNVIWGMPMHAQSYKVVMLNFGGYENTTATAQQIVYPVTFIAAPTSYGACPAGLVLTDGTRVTLPNTMSATFTGQCMVAGQ